MDKEYGGEGLKVNLGKTKGMLFGSIENIGKLRYGLNNIKCSGLMEDVVVYLVNCRKWIDGRCRGVSGKLQKVAGF